MCNPSGGNLIAQRFDNILLSHHLRKIYRTPLPIQGLICHCLFPPVSLEKPAGTAG
jgi:hypothetical protein